jgi:hypothetical protein
MYICSEGGDARDKTDKQVDGREVGRGEREREEESRTRRVDEWTDDGSGDTPYLLWRS